MTSSLGVTEFRRFMRLRTDRKQRFLAGRGERIQELLDFQVAKIEGHV
jgi:hypothetical protein